MMMKKKFVAVALSAVCLLSAVGCGQQSASTASSASSVSSSVASSASASQVMDAEDYLSGISGTYVELFPEMAKSEYRNLWIDAATPLVGEDNAESATDMLLGMCMAEPYGEEAVEKYAADPDSTAFNCYFLGGVEKFVMNGDTITGLDAQGHRFRFVGERREESLNLGYLSARVEKKFFDVQLQDATRLETGLWDRLEEDNLTGLFLRNLKTRMEQASPEELPLLERAARFGLCALEGREEPR